MTDRTPPLQGRLGLLDATMLVIGSMIGSGIFIVSAESSRLVGSPGLLILVWAIAGVMTITGALTCAELAAAMPKAGGQYVFLREAYGPATGFLFGWSLLFVIQSGTIAAVAVAFANFSGVLFPAISGSSYLIEPVRLGGYALSLSTLQLTAIVMILFLTWLNARGLRLGTLVQNTFTVAKTGALIGLIVIGLALGWGPDSAARSASWWDPVANGWSAAVAQPGLTATGFLAIAMVVGRAMVGPLFAQSAWNNVTFMGGEIRDPGKTLPRALLIGCFAVVALYLLANLAYVAVLPLEGIQHPPQNRVATAAMERVLGAPGTIAMAIAIMISTFGCNNGLIFAGARVAYAMARDGLFFRQVGTLNANQVPGSAILLQGGWAALLTIPRTVTEAPDGTVTYGNVYTQLLEYLIPADLMLYVLMVAAVFILRRKAPDLPRPYRTWGYPIVPALYIGLALLLIADLLWLTPRTAGVGTLIVLSGIPVYYVWRRRPGGVQAE